MGAWLLQWTPFIHRQGSREARWNGSLSCKSRRAAVYLSDCLRREITLRMYVQWLQRRTNPRGQEYSSFS
jgi:hypothetical protein